MEPTPRSRPHPGRRLAPLAVATLVCSGAFGLLAGPGGASSSESSCTTVSETRAAATPGATSTTVGPAGSVTVTFDGTALSVTDVVTADGWTAVTETATGPEVEVEFRDATGARWTFEAEHEVEHGTALLEFETERCTGPTVPPVPPVPPVIGPTTHPVGPAGSVTVTFDGTALSVTDVVTADGWTAVTETATGPEVEVEFRDATGARWSFEAEYEHGAVEVETEFSPAPAPPVTPPTTAPPAPAVPKPAPKATPKPAPKPAPKATPKPAPKATPKPAPKPVKS